MWGIGKIPEQARLLIRVMDAQLDILQQRLLSIGVELFGPDGGRDLSRWFPDHDKLFGHAQTVVGTAASVLANTLVIMFLGLLFSFDPGAYRDGVVLLASHRRATGYVPFWMKWAVSCARGWSVNLSGSCS